MVAALTNVPASVLDQVGAGSVSNPPKAVRGEAVLTDSGKPLILYVGAEYCPYCAAPHGVAPVERARSGAMRPFELQ